MEAAVMMMMLMLIVRLTDDYSRHITLWLFFLICQWDLRRFDHAP